MYEPSKRIAGFRVSGFQYWDGALVLEQLKPGALLDMRPESDNPHDPQAIAFYFDGSKLGYVPAAENEMLSVMFFYGHGDSFEARITKVDCEAEPWDQVRVGIFVKDVRNQK